MKVGDIVMFIDEGTYAKWFFGQIAIVEKYSGKVGTDGKYHCRVRWIQPVRYFDRMATVSNFCADKFEVYNESR